MQILIWSCRSTGKTRFAVHGAETEGPAYKTYLGRKKSDFLQILSHFLLLGAFSDSHEAEPAGGRRAPPEPHYGK